MSDILERLRSALGPRYVLEHELGEGGMAVVYLAHDTRHNRPVAPLPTAGSSTCGTGPTGRCGAGCRRPARPWPG